MNDTDSDVQRRLDAMYAVLSPAERVKKTLGMFETAKELVRAGLLNQNPSMEEDEIKTRIFLRFYSDCFDREEIERITSSVPGMKPCHDI